MNPLKARGRVLGTLTFLYHRAVVAEGASQFLAGLADRAALAIDSSTLYEQRRRHVVSLQRHLLPSELPLIPGITLSSAYEVGDVSLDVGGDFYDAVPRAQGGVTLLLGDVCGRGAEAAALTGLARHTLRTLLEDGSTPEHALERLNQALVREGTTRFVTALVVVLVPDGGGFVRATGVPGIRRLCCGVRMAPWRNSSPTGICWACWRTSSTDPGRCAWRRGTRW